MKSICILASLSYFKGLNPFKALWIYGSLGYLKAVIELSSILLANVYPLGN